MFRFAMTTRENFKQLDTIDITSIGIAGIFPVHYETYIDAWRNRIPQLKEAEEARNKFEKDAFEAQKANSFDYVNQKIKQ